MFFHRHKFKCVSAKKAGFAMKATKFHKVILKREFSSWRPASQNEPNLFW